VRLLLDLVLRLQGVLRILRDLLEESRLGTRLAKVTLQWPQTIGLLVKQVRRRISLLPKWASAIVALQRPGMLEARLALRRTPDVLLLRLDKELVPL